MVQNTDLKKVEGSKKIKLSTFISTVKSVLNMDSFFNKAKYSCIKIAIDETRHILYALSVNIKEKTDFIIHVYDLGPVSKDFQHAFDIHSIILKKK